MKSKKFPKCSCGHNFSDHQKKGYTMFGIGGWCRKCANVLGLECDSYSPLEWKWEMLKVRPRSPAYPDFKDMLKQITLDNLEKELR